MRGCASLLRALGVSQILVLHLVSCCDHTIATPALARSGRFRAFAQAPSDKDNAYKINSVDPEGIGAGLRNRDEPRAQRIAVEIEKQVYKTVRTLCVSLCVQPIVTCVVRA
jgi:hypothetical protein